MDMPDRRVRGAGIRCGRRDWMVRRETGSGSGRACERDCSGNVFGGNTFPGETEVPLDASRLAEWWCVLSQKHWNGKPDGAAGGANVFQHWSVDAILRRLEASPPKPRRLAQIKKNAAQDLCFFPIVPFFYGIICYFCRFNF